MKATTTTLLALAAAVVTLGLPQHNNDTVDLVSRGLGESEHDKVLEKNPEDLNHNVPQGVENVNSGEAEIKAYRKKANEVQDGLEIIFYENYYEPLGQYLEEVTGRINEIDEWAKQSATEPTIFNQVSKYVEKFGKARSYYDEVTKWVKEMQDKTPHENDWKIAVNFRLSKTRKLADSAEDLAKLSQKLLKSSKEVAGVPKELARLSAELAEITKKMNDIAWQSSQLSTQGFISTMRDE